MKLFKIKPSRTHDMEFRYVASEDIQTAIEKWRDQRPNDSMRSRSDAGTVIEVGEVIT